MISKGDAVAKNVRKPKSVSRPVPPARAAALEALYRCLEQDKDIQGTLDVALKNARLDPRDTALATELAYGYLRLRGRLEYVLSRFIQDLDRIPGKFRLALGVAAYEILFLDRVPVYASVDWAVEFAKSKPGARLSGLFNAVLRRVSELGVSAHEETFYADGAGTVETWSRYYSCPEWIVSLWLKAYGEERTQAYLKAQAEPPAVGVSLWGREDADELFGVLAGREDLLDIEGYSFAFRPGTSFPGLEPPLERRSFAARQGLEALQPDGWSTPVWDACSGRGGKTRVLLEKGISPLYASDVHMGRLRALRRDLPDVGAFRARADMGAPLHDMGTVLLDLPCSGLGVLARRPDAKWRRKPSDLASLSNLQRDILETAVEAVAPGGSIAVVTCTLNPEENEQQIESLVGRHTGMRETVRWTTPVNAPFGEFFFASLLECP